MKATAREVACNRTIDIQHIDIDVFVFYFETCTYTCRAAFSVLTVLLLHALLYAIAVSHYLSSISLERWTCSN